MTKQSPRFESEVLGQRAGIPNGEIGQGRLENLVRGQLGAHVSPAVGNWIAGKVLACDASICAMLLVDLSGRVLAHDRVGDAGCDEVVRGAESGLIVPVPGQSLLAYVRYAGEGVRARVYSKVFEFFSSENTGVSR